MKRARKLLAILAASVLTLGMVSTVTASSAKTYTNLKSTEKTYYANGGRNYGTYPEIDGMAALNAEIYDTIWKALSNTERNYGDSSESNLFKASYKITDETRYATIELTLRFQAATNSFGTKTETVLKYVDKDGMKVITEADYKKGIEAQKAAAPAAATPAPAKAAEVVLVPIAKNAEALGYTVTWIEELSTVRLNKGDVWKSVTVGKNKYIIDGEIVELDAAPSLQDNIVYVPVSFFQKVLGATVNIDKEGKVTIK